MMKLRLPSRRKVWEWIERYGPQELVAMIGAFATAHYLKPLLLQSGLTWAHVGAAYVVTFADAIVYYLFAQVREFMRHRRSGEAFLMAFVLSLRDLAVEYGAADLVDTVVTRPFFIYWCPQITGTILTGIPLATLCAGVIFYGIVIPSYELRKRIFRDQSRRKSP